MRRRIIRDIFWFIAGAVVASAVWAYLIHGAQWSFLTDVMGGG